MLQYFLSTVLLSIGGFFHPIHVSVTDVVYDQERKALEITSHVFIDDVEKQIRKQLNEPYLDITKPTKGRTTDALIENYFRKYFSLKVNDKEVTYNYIGHENEMGAFYVYLEVEKVKKLNSIKVRNEVLIDIHDDQVNLVHVKVDGKIRSMKLEEDNKEDVLEYN